MADYLITGAVSISVAIASSVIYNPTGSAYDTNLSGYGIYDGLTIPPDSMLMYESGQHDGGDNQASLTDSGASFPVDGYNTGFTLRNTSKRTSGIVETADITDGTATNLVGTLSNSADWDDDNYYEVIVSGMSSGDRIYHDPQAVDGAFSYQLYDASDYTFSAVYEYTITLPYNGAVSVNSNGVASIQTASGEIGGNITVSVVPAATMQYAPTAGPPPGEEISGSVTVTLTPQASFDANIARVETSRINYHPKYVKTKRRPKDESILNAVYDLVDKLEASPIQPPTTVKKKVNQVVKKAEKASVIQDVERQSNELQATMLEIDKLQTIIVEHTLKAQKDEADAINALLNII